jgi:hypothetical protein
MGVVARIETPDRSRYGIIRGAILDGAVSGYPSDLPLRSDSAPYALTFHVSLEHN